MITERQEQVLRLLLRESPIGPRRVAGEFGMRSQDAGRVLNALERKGLVEFTTGPPSGYRPTASIWDDEPEIDFIRDLTLNEIEALIENAEKQVWIYTRMAKHTDDSEYLAMAKWYTRRRRVFYELKAELERDLRSSTDA